ncbi:hypothetical protein [Pseudomonas nitroreducens]|uniref:hypothetical protein n=1 Tax=Pseudomonas nitroreducens TaxID=46680 RepID=UPI0028A98B22|nr:hypothetical protein [Pseudomonas nitroreducens]
MTRYVRVEDGVVAEIIEDVTYEDPEESFRDIYGEEAYLQAKSLAGKAVPIEARFSEEFISSLIDVSEIDPMPEQGWLYDNGAFVEP